MTVASTTVVTNLNADLLDGVQGALYSQIVAAETLTNKNLATGNSGTIKLVDGDGNHFTTIAAHATTAADIAYTWPDNAPGTSGYALTSTTGGVMSWAAAGGDQTPWTGNIDAAGYSLDNLGNANTDLGATSAGQWQLAHNGGEFHFRVQTFSSNNAAHASHLNFQRSYSNTLGGHTAVRAGDNLGDIAFYGSSGSAFEVGAKLQATANQNFTGSVNGSRLEFLTTADGSQSPAIRM